MPSRAIVPARPGKASLLLFSVLAFCAVAAWPQSAVTRVDGRITKEGKSLVGARVVLSQQETFAAFKATTDKYGTFSISDVPRGEYLVSILTASDDLLYRKPLALTSAPDAPIRLDLEISPGFASAGSSSPAANSSSSSAPASPATPSKDPKAAEMDALYRRYVSAQRAGDHNEEAAALKALVAADPARWDYFEALGDTQSNLGDLDGAVHSYDLGIQAAQHYLSSTAADTSVITKSERERTRSGMAAMLQSAGNTYLKLKKTDEAIAAYTKAAELSSDPATAYYNLCVVHYNARKIEGAAQACDKAIAADPARADAYFIKGALQLLAVKPDKDGRIIAPPGTVEALKKYLELAPQGPQAKSARQMLDYIGANGQTAGRDKKPS